MNDMKSKMNSMSKEEKVEIGAQVVKVGLTSVLAYRAGRQLATSKPIKVVEPTDQEKLGKNMGELKSGLYKVGAGSFGLANIATKGLRAEAREYFSGKDPIQLHD